MAQLVKEVDCKSLLAKCMRPKPNQEKEFLYVAEMIGDCCLQIDGTYPAMGLIKGRKYEVYFVIELRDHDGILTNRRVTLRLTGPDGTTHEHQENLSMMPRNELIQLKVGEFNNVMRPGYKNVKFSLHGCDDTTWKGFTIIGAIICEPLPKPFI